MCQDDIAVDIPPIIDRATFKRAAELRSDKRLRRAGLEHEYLLTGRMHCGKCGASGNVSTTTSGGKLYFRYRCGTEYDPGEYGRICRKDNLSADRIDKAVCEWLMQFRNERAIRAALDEREDALSIVAEPLSRWLRNLYERINDLEADLENLVSQRLYGHQRTAKIFREREDAIVASLEELENERDELEDELDGMRFLTDAEREELLSLAMTFSTLHEAEDVPFETKLEIVERVNLRAKLIIQDGRKGVSINSDLGSVVLFA